MTSDTPPDTLPKYRLRFTNKYGETFWFISLGLNWPHHPDRRLISRTALSRELGTIFDTLPEALAILVTAGDPPDWVVETLDGKTVE